MNSKAYVFIQVCFSLFSSYCIIYRLRVFKVTVWVRVSLWDRWLCLMPNIKALNWIKLMQCGQIFTRKPQSTCTNHLSENTRVKYQINSNFSLHTIRMVRKFPSPKDPACFPEKYITFNLIPNVHHITDVRNIIVKYFL